MRLSISVGVIVVLIVILFILSSSISKYAATLVDGRQQLLARSAQLQAFATLRSDYNREAKNDLSLLYGVVPIEDQLINLPKDLQFLASQDNLEYSFSFVGRSSPSDQSLGSIQVQLSLEGPFEKLISFVQRLQNFKYLTKVTSVNISKVAGTAYQMTVRAQVAFR